MRVLFSVSGWPTHYRSMVPLGWALQAAGHDVRVLCPTSEVDSVSRAGLTPVPALGGLPPAVRIRLRYVQQAMAGDWPYPWLPVHPLSGEPMDALSDFDVDGYHRTVEPRFAESTRRSFDNAVTFARAWRPELVVFDPYGLEGLLVGRVLGVPAALSLWGPVGTEEPPYVAILTDDFSGSFLRHGIPPMSPDLIDHVIDHCPPTLRPPTRANRLPVRYIPYNGPGPLRDWTLEPPRRPRVVVVWSTALSTMSGPRSLVLPDVLAGLAELDVDVVLTATPRDVASIGSRPAGTRVLENCPVHLLLDGASATVHHGGAGNTMTALWAGVPQLALTCAPEPAANGERVARTGAGRHLPVHEASPDAVCAAVGALLREPGYARHAVRLRDELVRMPTPAQLVDALGGLVG